MYYPYFRGKQNELITIRDNAELLASRGIVPIIEPVKNATNGLSRALDAVVEAGGNTILIINPHYGDFSKDGQAIRNLFEAKYSDYDGISIGVLLTEQTSSDEAMGLYRQYEDRPVCFIHHGFSDARLLAEALGEAARDIQHVFIADHCGKLYRRHFPGNNRVLLRDGFNKTKNSSYPSVEFFSDLHITYEEEGVNGFGDFLTVGDDYSETGGPAYAIAIHLTFINPAKDDEMYVFHFISIRQDTPTDPAGKFAEALAKLVNQLDQPDSNVLETQAVVEFRDLHNRGHFPGLGYVKKLSMQHHIETLADFIEA